MVLSTLTSISTRTGARREPADGEELQAQFADAVDERVQRGVVDVSANDRLQRKNLRTDLAE